ncbi:MAG: asparagine synthetase A [Candidatus Lokiarchaeota archaeon]|nr:asparagine synthetase A [Candidatus Harpocratesius repetitus]
MLDTIKKTLKSQQSLSNKKEKKLLKYLNSQDIDIEKRTALLRIQTEVLKALHDSLYSRGFIQLMPVILSPITDPLNHSVYDASIHYSKQQLQLTKSMILHKQLALSMSRAEGIYIVSPNVRLETEEKEQSLRHLLEFSQVDIELRHASQNDFMTLMENVIVEVLKHVKSQCQAELAVFESNLIIPSRPFPRYSSESAFNRYGRDFEQILSDTEKSLFWITDYKREFYDKEDPNRPGHYINYDLFYPEGFNEALSGGEREYEYEVILRKLKERNQDPSAFSSYLKFAKKGKLFPSAGGGLGVERLLRFITKQANIADVCLFPKVPGEKIIF